MPNWCENGLIVNVRSEAGAGAQLLDFIERVEPYVENGEIGLLNEFVPMPEALKHLHQGSATLRVRYPGNIINKEPVRVWLPEHKRIDQDYDVTVEELQRFEAKLRKATEEHGSADWYSWALAHWGTKWDVTVYRRYRNLASAAYTFSSAWGPPIEWTIKLSTQFDKLRFSLGYAEGGACFWGHAVYEAGECQDSSESMDFWRDIPEGMEDGDWYDLDDIDRVTAALRDHMEEFGIGTGG